MSILFGRTVNLPLLPDYTTLEKGKNLGTKYSKNLRVFAYILPEKMYVHTTIGKLGKLCMPLLQDKKNIGKPVSTDL